MNDTKSANVSGSSQTVVEPSDGNALNLRLALPPVSEWYEALRLLYDYQNGCPLPSYAKAWGEAMDESARLITIYERAKKPHLSSHVTKSEGGSGVSSEDNPEGITMPYMYPPSSPLLETEREEDSGGTKSHDN